MNFVSRARGQAVPARLLRYHGYCARYAPRRARGRGGGTRQKRRVRLIVRTVRPAETRTPSPPGGGASRRVIAAAVTIAKPFREPKPSNNGRARGTVSRVARRRAAIPFAVAGRRIAPSVKGTRARGAAGSRARGPKTAANTADAESKKEAERSHLAKSGSPRYLFIIFYTNNVCYVYGARVSARTRARSRRDFSTDIRVTSGRACGGVGHGYGTGHCSRSARARAFYSRRPWQRRRGTPPDPRAGGGEGAGGGGGGGGGDRVRLSPR